MRILWNLSTIFSNPQNVAPENTWKKIANFYCHASEGKWLMLIASLAKEAEARGINLTRLDF